MTTPTITLDYLEAAGKELLRIEAEIERLEEMRAGIHATFKQARAQGVIDPAGSLGPIAWTTRRGARRLNPKRIEQAYPAIKHPELYAPRLDTTAVRRAFAPDDLARFEDVGEDTLTVKAAK